MDNCIGLVCILAAQLTAGDVGYSNGMPDVAYSYDNQPRDISRFYQDEQTNFYAEGYVILDTRTRIRIGYDHGIDTQKYDVSKAYTIGVDQAIRIDDNSDWLISGTTTFGGEQRHIPCVDSEGVNYYCGNLTLWSTFKEPEYEQPYEVRITFVHRF